MSSKNFGHSIPKLDEWTLIEVEQSKLDEGPLGGRHLFKFHVGGLPIYSEVFSKCGAFDNVQVYTGPTNVDFSVSIKDFTIETKISHCV